MLSISHISNANQIVFIYSSQSKSRKPIVVALNFGENWQTIDLSTRYGLPKKLKIVVASIESQYNQGWVQGKTIYSKIIFN